MTESSVQRPKISVRTKQVNTPVKVSLELKGLKHPTERMLIRYGAEDPHMTRFVNVLRIGGFGESLRALEFDQSPTEQLSIALMIGVDSWGIKETYSEEL